MVKVGVIGTGWWAADLAHLPALKSSKGIEIAAVSDINPERLKEVAERYRIERQYIDYHELLNNEEIQAVCITVPSYQHYTVTMDALSKKKHVLCEKPLAMNFEQAKKMYERAKSAGVKHMVPFTWRFVPAAERMKELIEKGYLGRVFHVEARYLAGHLSDANFPASWRMQKKFAGTGALADTAYHLIDLIRWTVGEFNSVVGDMAIFIKERKEAVTEKKVKVDVDDSSMFLAKLSDGVQAVVHASRVARARENYIDLEISGDKGTLVFRLEVEGTRWAKGELYGSQKVDAKIQQLPVPERLLKGYEKAETSLDVKFLFTKIMQTFKEGIESGKELVPNFYDGMKAQEVMQAVEDSSARRMWIQL